jgi:hypothetical protein
VGGGWSTSLRHPPSVEQDGQAQSRQGIVPATFGRCVYRDGHGKIDLLGYGPAAPSRPLVFGIACFGGRCLLRRRAIAHQDNTTRGDDDANRRVQGSILAGLSAPSKHGASGCRRVTSARPDLHPKFFDHRGSRGVYPSRSGGGTSLACPAGQTLGPGSTHDVASFLSNTLHDVHAAENYAVLVSVTAATGYTRKLTSR